MRKNKPLTQKEKDQPLMVRFTTWFYKACGRRHAVDQAVPVGKANPLKEDEIFYTAFEPKTNHRHLVKVTNKDGKEVFPTFVIKKVARPSFEVDKVYRGENEDGGGVEEKILRYDPIRLTLYDPIVPSTSQAVYITLRGDDNCYGLSIRVLGPVGDTVEEWEVKNAKITKVSFSTMDWSKTGDPATVNVWFQSDDITLKY
jgi:hypothetical protein